MTATFYFLKFLKFLFMRKAKIALTIVTIFGLVAGSLAYKSNRQLRVFYTLSTTLMNGEEKIGCCVSVILSLTPVVGSGFVTQYSSTFNVPTTTCTCKVIEAL